MGKSKSCNSIILDFQQHKRNSILSLQSKKKVEPIYNKAGGGWKGGEGVLPSFQLQTFQPPSFCSELTLELVTRVTSQKHL